ncbi:GtrA family protein [Chitinibacter bivalviorum]|uniref:GtrA family protein n=1 Tax=Chitinibacter bivalviorum TaxID=2739434 RepID=A0A7H9BMM5_9NEIS|nr:GtrA family protein [Chitinibacter bivalviorum]QLG89692.1 GtrA family protein [Chitinibacter bivalviorum]
MPHLLKQFLTFAAVGLCGTAIQYVLLWFGVEHLGMKAAIASGVGYALGSVANYLLNYFFTFKAQHGQKSHREAAAKYYTITGIGWGINTGLMALLVGQLHIHYWPAQIVTTGIGLIWNFAGSRWWAFRHPSASEQASSAK